MANIGELSVWVKVDQASINKSTKQVQDSFKKTWDSIEKNMTAWASKSVSKITSWLSGLSATIAGIFSVGAIVAFWKALFSLWSDATEVGSKFDVVFKSNEKVAQSFRDLADATNRSSLDMMTFGAGIGNVLAPLGLAQSEVDGLSLSLTKLAVDVASFQNVSDAQAVHAFTSALTGERESLKSLGIVISEDDVKNKAYTLGLAEQGQELTKAQKALSTYQLLIQNTANAHGDAIRTADSFANQLKGLRGAIKDVFANAGKDVAGSTSWLLKKLTVFTSSYGGAIIDSIVMVGKTIGWVVNDLFGVFGDLFGFLKTWTWESTDSMNNFAFVFMKVLQFVSWWIKFISTIVKNMADVFRIALAWIIEYFVATFRSISAWWNIVKTLFVGTIKSIIDVAQLGAEAVWQVFVGMAEAIVGVFQGIADNVGVAVKKAVNVAVNGINGFLDLVNKIPWVKLERLIGFGDLNFKPFELKITKNIDALKGKFENFGTDIKGNYAGIGDSFGEISWNFATATQNVMGVAEIALENMGNDWQEWGTDVIASNDKVNKSLADGAKKSQENAKKYDEGYFNILDLIDKYKGGVDSANEKTKGQWDVAKKTMDKVKELYKEWEKKIDDLNKAQKKLAEDTKKYNQDIEDSLRSLTNELKKTTSEYEKTVWELGKKGGMDIASRGVEIANDLVDIEKEIAELKIKSTTDADDAIKKQNDLLELEKKKTALLKEQEFVVKNTSEAQRTEATRVGGLSEAEKIKEETDAEIAEKDRAFQAEKLRLESLDRINNYFLQLKTFTQQDYNNILKDQTIQAMTQEEQELIFKLAREKLQLSNQKDAIIAMQQEVHDATVKLNDSAYAIQKANINSLKGEYAELINQINQAIILQAQLNAMRASGGAGFASGWFTGDGWANQVAWVVHKGEWVAPKWMVNSMRPLFDNLESKRSKGFESGGNTSTTNKTQTNNITVNNGADLKGFIDYAKWKM